MTWWEALRDVLLVGIPVAGTLLGVRWATGGAAENWRKDQRLAACVEFLRAVDATEFALSWIPLPARGSDQPRVDEFLRQLAVIEQAGVRIEFLFNGDAVTAAMDLKAIWYGDVQKAVLDRKAGLDFDEVFVRENRAYVAFVNAARPAVGIKDQLSEDVVRRIFETPRRRRGLFS